MSKYTDMQKHYESRLVEVKELYESRITELIKEREHYRHRYHDELAKSSKMQGQVHIYEKLLAKLLGESTNTDDIFMYDGKLYTPTAFTLMDNRGEGRQLNVDFVEYPHSGKEGDRK